MMCGQVSNKTCSFKLCQNSFTDMLCGSELRSSF
jgi:hypothetical protein